MTVEEYGLYRNGLVAQNPGPVRHKGISICWVSGREGGHNVLPG